jgi:hypothetical protein
MKLKLLLITIALFVGFGSWGQVTITSQDFESTPATPTLTFSNTNGGNSTGTNLAGGNPANADLFAGGARGWQVLNNISTLTFANQLLTGYTNSFVDFRLAGMSVNGTNGIDTTDTLTILISVDGGTSYSSELIITGSAANQRWAFNASGSTSITYDGNNSPTTVVSPSATGISTVTINIPNANSQVRVRIEMSNNDANERWVIDDVILKGTLAVPTQLAFVSVPTTGTTGTPLSTFTVETRNAGNTLVNSYTGNVTLTKASGTGSINGTLSANAVAGIATFNNIAFNQASTYTVTAASAGLTSATSGNVVVSNPSTNVFGGDGINWVGSNQRPTAYSQPINCVYPDYRVLKYRKVNTITSLPTDGRGQWATTITSAASGADVSTTNMTGGSNNGFVFTSGGGCGNAGNFANKWNFAGVGSGTVNIINGMQWKNDGSGNDMGLDMSTAGKYTFVFKDAGYTTTGYYVGYTTNTPVTISHNTATQRTLNNDGNTTITATISATNSSQEKFYVRYKTGSNDFSTGTSTISAVGSIVGTAVTLTIPVQADGAVVYYYIFSSTMSQLALAALSEGDKSYALLNYADNSGSNYSYTALSLTPTVTSIVPTAVTGVTGQANNTGFKGQTITINGTNFQSNSTVTISGVAATSVTFISASQLTAVVANTGANFTGNVVVANPTPATSVTVPSFIFLGYITSGTGAINTASNWLGGSVPLANSTVTIAHAMTHITGATTNTPFESLTIPSGGSLGVGTTGAIAVTNAITTLGTGSLSLTVSSATVSAGSVSNAGTISWSSTGTLTINAGGSFTNTGTVTSGTVGNVVFAGAGTINGSTPITFNNLTINGATTLTTVPIINGTLQLNSGSSVTATPTYGGSSTLVYNTTGTYGVSNEWTGNNTTAGSGIPQNVTIQNSTTLSMPNTNRGLAGNLNISSGNLTLNASSGDLYIAGNWTRVSTATFTPNNRAVFFNGSTAQTVTVTATGTETFNFLLIQGSGTLKLATGTAINVTASSGLSLSSSNITSTIDLNGQTLTLSGGGNLNLNAGNRFITSSVTNGKFAITSNIITVTNGGTLTTSATNTTVDLQNGLNCGTGSLFTINGTLQINTGGFCTGNSPRYGASSLLHYNSGINPYNRQLEWTSDIAAIGTIGLPTNVQISNATTLNYINAANSGPKGIAGNLTIDSGSSLIMNYSSVSSAGALTVFGNLTNAGTLILGQLSGDDLRLGGNFNNTGGTFNGFDRAIFFIRSATGIQLITAPAGITIPYIVIQPAAATDTVQLAAGTNLTISAPLAGIALTFTNPTDVFDINSNTLIIGTYNIANTINGTGTFKGSVTSNMTLLGTGSIGTLNFTPTFQNLGTLTMNRQATTMGCTMGSAVTINSALNLTNGLISLGNFDMSLGLTATNTGSANGFVISDPDIGTGMLIKRVNSLGAYTLHIGENTAPNGSQYAPATINFSSGSFSPLAHYGVQVKDAIHLNIDSPTDYLTKYWIITSSGTFTTPVYSFTGLYNSGTADVNGTESNSISAKWDGTKWTNGTAIGGGILTISGLTTMATSTTNEISAGNRNREININGLTGGTNNIVSGSTTANGLNNTLFAATNLGSSVTKDYEIQNLGIAALNLTGTPIVSIGGANPGDFVVTTVPSTPIIGGSSTSFITTFSPTYAGIRTAIVSIANNDSDENPYTFLIQGNGTCPTTTNTISPISGPEGTEVTITSSNSATNNLTGATATFNGTTATIVSSSATKLVVLVPPLASSGNLVTTNATGCQATNAFTVIDNKANTCQGGTIASDLFISEVTDSNSGGLTYVEIYNGTGSTVNLSTYHIDFYNNGSPTQNGGTVPFGNVNLLSGNTFTIAVGVEGSPFTNTCSGQNDQYNGSLANLLSGISGVNFKTGGENDHIKLYNITTQIDSWGLYNDGYWANGLGIGTEGATFRRKNTASLVQPITYANADWDITDWTDCANNDYSDIGTYNFISGTPPTVTTHPSYTPTCKTTSLTVIGTEGYNGTSPADSKELTYRWLFSAPNETGWNEITSDGGIYTGTTTATLNISNIATVLNYQYYCQIRENTNTCYAASNAIKITDGGTTTWNGAWTNGPPTIDKLVIINANYNTLTVGLDSFSACSVVVNSGKTLTITENKYVKIQNDLTNNGTVTVKNNGSLVQVSDAGVNTNVGTGSFTYERDYTGISTYDYTYWSSPVASQNLLALSPTTKLDKFFSFDAASNDWLQENPSIRTMYVGKGYIIRAAPWTGPPPGFLTNTFIGVPNNGSHSITGVIADKSYLLGNPYPSALDAETFLNANAGVLNGTLYFWTHNTNIQSYTDIIAAGGTPGTGFLAYTSDDYATYNASGGVAVTQRDIDPKTGLPYPGPAPSGSLAPSGKIASGQGFFASTKTTLSGSPIQILYNNSMRVGVGSITGDNTQFFKTKNQKNKTATIEKHRIWLNLRNTQGAFKQTLVGYITDATNEYDSRFDGETFDGNEFVDFYSINQDKNLAIQGRALPFDENDEVPLGFRTTIDGAFTINIDQADGLLTNQAVFIEDKLTNTTFDLRSGPFTFNTAAGTFNDRFVLRYTNKTLGTIDVETSDNQVLVSNKNKQIKINSNTETIDKVAVYDLLGRQLFKKDKVSSNELAIPNLVSSQQTLLVKVILQNGQTVTKKIIY